MEQRKFRMPTAYTILFCLIILVAVTTWFIPAGSYDYLDGVPVSGSYHAVEPAPQGAGAGAESGFQRVLRCGGCLRVHPDGRRLSGRCDENRRH